LGGSLNLQLLREAKEGAPITLMIALHQWQVVVVVQGREELIIGLEIVNAPALG
jgi:hypothetical protein